MILFGGLFFVATALHILAVSMIRYRIPYIDTYFCVLAGIAAQSLSSKLRNLLPNPNIN
jgi:hypothetical protein